MKTIALTKPEGAAQWLGIYRLYHSAFPKSERKPFSMIRKMARKGKTDVWRVQRDGKMLGLAITINGEKEILLDYLAVSPRHRGEGIGTRILEKLGSIYPDKGLFLEIESVYDDTPNQPERQRRKEFYLRCGLVPMNVMVNLFGVKMELLGRNCTLTYDQYHAFYHDNYSPWAAEHITKAHHPAE